MLSSRYPSFLTKVGIHSILLVMCVEAITDETSLAESLWIVDTTDMQCGGMYQWSQLSDLEEGESRQEGTTLSADQVVIDLDGTAQVTGDVVLDIQGNRVQAPSLAFDTNSQEFETPEGAIVVYRGVALSVERSEVQLSERRLDLDDAQFVMLNEGYRGRTSSFFGTESTLEFENASVTRCPPNVNSWAIKARTFKVDRMKQVATARGVQLRLGRLPIVYIPYFKFPIRPARTSGLLAPEVERDSLRGFELSLPIYVNLAPNYDLTVTPRISSRDTHQMEMEFRYLSQFGDARTRAIYLFDDGQFRAYVRRLYQDLKIPIARSGDRWLFELQNQLNWESWTSRVKYSLVSDTDFFRDFGESIEPLDHVAMARQFSLSYWGRSFTLHASAERYDPFRNWGSYSSSVPQLSADWYQSIGPLVAEASLNWARSEAGPWTLHGPSTRTHGEISLSLPLTQIWGYSRFEYKHSQTEFSFDSNWSFDRSVESWQIDSGLNFVRKSTAGAAWGDSIQPRIVYVNQSAGQRWLAPSLDTGPIGASINSLIEPNRAAGLDRLYSVNAVSLSVDARLSQSSSLNDGWTIRAAVLSPIQEKSMEILDETGYGIELTARLSRELSLSGFHLKHSDRWTNQATGSTIRFKGSGADLIVQIRHQQPGNIWQSFVNANVVLSQNWKIYSRLVYDWEDERHIDTYAGFEYSGCCVAYRILWRKTLRYGFADWEDVRSRSKLLFEFSLKGLTSFGDNIESIVNNRYW